MIRTILERWSDDRSGNVAMLFGLMFVPVMVVTGMSVDYARALSARGQLQNAADAAALAAAAATQASTAEKTTLAEAMFTANTSGITEGVTPNVVVNGNTVSVTAAQNVPTTLTKLAGVDNIPVSATSSATPTTGSSTSSTEPPFCVLLLEENETGLYVNSDSELNTNCKVHVNSSHEKAAELNSHSKVITGGLYVRGDAYVNSGTTVTPAAVEGASKMDDPLATLAEPPQRNWGCDHNDYKVSSGQTRTMWPGIYCGKTLIENNGTGNMMPGIYVFKKELEVNSDATLNGTGVMLYFRGDNAYAIVNSDSTMKISAPTSGTYAGILLFQSRGGGSGNASPFKINSDASSKFEGTIYMPKGTLEVNSHSTANALASYTAIIARKMILNSSGTLQLRSDFEDSTPLPADLEEFLPQSEVGSVLLN